MTQEIFEHKTIEQIRQQGLNKEVMERIAAERAEMERQKQEQKERLPGKFISFKSDKETKTPFFTGECQKYDAPAKDFLTKQEIPGKTITRYRFQVYDMTTYDPNNPPEAGIWERGMTEADQVLYWFDKGVTELTIMRNGGPNSKSTTYDIFPYNR